MKDEYFYRDIPASGALIGEAEVNNIIKVAKDKWFTEGEMSAKFSKKLKTELGVRHISLCNSGSSANLLAITALNDTHHQRTGYKVLTSATCFPTTITPIIQNKLTPVFIDTDPRTLNPPLDMVLEELRDPNIVGYVQAHTLGFPYDARAIRARCDELGIFFVEDCADAFGGQIYDQNLGSFGHAGTFSFFPAHHITTGEGGAISTNDGRLYRLINSLRDWGRDCWCAPGQTDTCNKRFGWEWKDLPEGWDHKYTFTQLGFNLKMTDLQAAIGVAQMDFLGKLLWDRFTNYLYLYAGMSDYLELIDTAIPEVSDCVFHPFGYPMIVKTDRFTKRDLVAFLEFNGIKTREIFAGNITRHPMAKKFQYKLISSLDGSDYLMERAFWVGVWSGLEKEDMEYIADKVRQFLQNRGLL